MNNTETVDMIGKEFEIRLQEMRENMMEEATNASIDSLLYGIKGIRGVDGQLYFSRFDLAMAACGDLCLDHPDELSGFVSEAELRLEELMSEVRTTINRGE